MVDHVQQHGRRAVEVVAQVDDLLVLFVEDGDAGEEVGDVEQAVAVDRRAGEAQVAGGDDGPQIVPVEGEVDDADVLAVGGAFWVKYCWVK